MASAASLIPAQPQSYKTFKEIEGDFCTEEVICRLIHFWEARNFKKNNILMGLQLLLIDNTSTTIQGFIPVSRLFRFEPGLKANSVYKLKRFMIKSSRDFFKVTDHKFEITFTDQTSFVEVPEAGDQIAKQWFRLRLPKDFAPIVDINEDLYDIIGKITLIRGDNLHSPTVMDQIPEVSEVKSKDMVFLHLLLKDGETIRIYIWEKIAAAFRTRWNESDIKPTVLLLTTVNPKTIGGALSLSSTSSTRLFFDSDIPETDKYLSWLGEENHTTPTVTTSSSAITELETVTLNELHQFIKTETPQVASFICTATISEILGQYGWYYIACSNCNNKLGKSNNSLFCSKCNRTNNIGILGYRLEISVRDNTDDATFAIMDNDGTKFVGRTAREVLNEATQVGLDDNSGSINSTTPKCFLHIIGRTCKFQVKVTKFNFEAARQTFTVSRITDDNVISQPITEASTSTGEETEIPIAPKEKTKNNESSVDPEEFVQKKKQKVDENTTPKEN